MHPFIRNLELWLASNFSHILFWHERVYSSATTISVLHRKDKQIIGTTVDIPTLVPTIDISDIMSYHPSQQGT